MEIDSTAPAVARSEIEIAAPAAIVWSVLADIARWPSWNPDVKSASLEGDLAEGATFSWKAGLGTIRSTLRRVEPPGLIAWTGTTLGIDAIHVYRLEQEGTTTIVSSEESWDGLLVRMLRRTMARTLQRSLDSGLRHVKAEAERRAAATTAS